MLLFHCIKKNRKILIGSAHNVHFDEKLNGSSYIHNIPNSIAASGRPNKRNGKTAGICSKHLRQDPRTRQVNGAIYASSGYPYTFISPIIVSSLQVKSSVPSSVTYTSEISIFFWRSRLFCHRCRGRSCSDNTGPLRFAPAPAFSAAPTSRLGRHMAAEPAHLMRGQARVILLDGRLCTCAKQARYGARVGSIPARSG